MIPDLRRLVLVTTALTALLAAQDAHAWGNPFKKKNKATSTVPAGEEMRAAEMTAAELMGRARAEEAAGKAGAAIAGYKKIVTTYGYTSMAPPAQFRIAAALEKDRKYEKAFEAYQELITNYRQTPQFSEALDRQYGIASQSRSEKTGRTLGFKSRIGAEDQVAMFQKIIANAPQGTHAAASQYEIGLIHEEEEERDSAISAYKKVVQNYPRSPLAVEAQGKIGKTYMAKIDEGSRDRNNITEARKATEEGMGLFPGAPGDIMGTTGAIDDAAADSSYETGRFYQKKGNYRAAMIYYSDVLKNPGSSHYEEVRDRVNEMSSKDPTVMDSMKNLALDTRSLAVPAAANLKGKAEYFGPPGPNLASTVRRPQMRSDFVPNTPLEPGDLPAIPGAPDNSLLDPNQLPPPDTTTPMPEAPPILEPTPAPAPEPPAPEAPAPDAKVEEKPAIPVEEQPKAN